MKGLLIVAKKAMLFKLSEENIADIHRVREALDRQTGLTTHTMTDAVCHSLAKTAADYTSQAKKPKKSTQSP